MISYGTKIPDGVQRVPHRLVAGGTVMGASVLILCRSAAAENRFFDNGLGFSVGSLSASQEPDVSIDLYWSANAYKSFHAVLVCIMSALPVCIENVFIFWILYCACMRKDTIQTNMHIN